MVTTPYIQSELQCKCLDHNIFVSKWPSQSLDLKSINLWQDLKISQLLHSNSTWFELFCKHELTTSSPKHYLLTKLNNKKLWLLTFWDQETRKIISIFLRFFVFLFPKQLASRGCNTLKPHAFNCASEVWVDNNDSHRFPAEQSQACAWVKEGCVLINMTISMKQSVDAWYAFKQDAVKVIIFHKAASQTFRYVCTNLTSAMSLFTWSVLLFGELLVSNAWSSTRVINKRLMTWPFFSGGERLFSAMTSPAKGSTLWKPNRFFHFSH